MAKNKEEKTITDMVLVKDVDTVDTQSIMDQLDAELKKQKHIEETPWKTADGVVEGFPKSIKDETLITNLVRMYASVISRQKAYDSAQTELGFASVPVFTLNGYGVDAYKHDIQLREAIIRNKETLETLKEFKKEVSQFLTEADKKKALFNRMAKFFDKQD